MRVKKFLVIIGLYFISGLMQQAYAQSCTFGTTGGHLAGRLGNGIPLLTVYQVYQGMSRFPTGSEWGSVDLDCTGTTQFKFESVRGTPNLTSWTPVLGTDSRNVAKYTLNVTSSIGGCNRTVTYDARNNSMTPVADCPTITSSTRYKYTVTYTISEPMKMYSEVENAYGGPMGALPLELFKYTVGGLVGGAQLGLVPRIDQCTNPSSFTVTTDKRNIDLSVVTGQTKNESFNINITKRASASSLCKRPVNPRIRMTTTKNDSQGVINLGNGYNLILKDWTGKQVTYGSTVFTTIPAMTTQTNLQYRVTMTPRTNATIKEGEFNHVINYGIEFR